MEDTATGQHPATPGPRTRIRDAAPRQFAAHGFKGATGRCIAHETGVSPGLVQHHFPSRQALRDERGPSAVARIGRARLYLAAERLIHEDLEARVREGLDRYQHPTTDRSSR
ncbi:MAG: TetR family transcriptional regulator [Streptosporangiales bacterium]|nr:TetR family transcriptional regulator [Streptosporangiales bacterium]